NSSMNINNHPLPPNNNNITIPDWFQTTANNTKFEIFQASVLPDRVQMRNLLISPPSNTKEIDDVAVSPDGGRIAWVMRTSPIHWWWSDWLGKLLPRFNTKQQYQISIWVSRLNGSAMCELGHISLWPDKSGHNEIYNLRWLPVSNQISFIYGNSLWIVDCGSY
ncbi:MAG TPA: hypothetical protein VKT32_01230, partial [Chthonomonadaceae bacterium]|nr:hypothetical protein [Chthonomonadaceae bacterium]